MTLFVSHSLQLSHDSDFNKKTPSIHQSVLQQRFKINRLAQHDAFINFIRSTNRCYEHQSHNTSPSQQTLHADTVQVSASVDAQEQTTHQRLQMLMVQAKTQGTHILANDEIAQQSYVERLNRLNEHLINKVMSSEQQNQDVSRFVRLFSERIRALEEWSSQQQLLHIAAFPMPIENADEWKCVDGIIVRLELLSEPTISPFIMAQQQLINDAIYSLSHAVSKGNEVHLSSALYWLITGHDKHHDVHFKVPLHELCADDIYRLLTQTPIKYMKALTVSINEYTKQLEEVMSIKRRYLTAEESDEVLLMQFDAMKDKLKVNAWTKTFKLELQSLLSNGELDSEGSITAWINKIFKQSIASIRCINDVPEVLESSLQQYVENIPEWCRQLELAEFTSLASLVALCLPVLDKRLVILHLLNIHWKQHHQLSLAEHLQALTKTSAYVACWSDIVINELKQNCSLPLTLMNGDEFSRYCQSLSQIDKKALLQQCVDGGASFSVIKSIIDSGIDGIQLTSINWLTWLNSPKLVDLLALLHRNIDINGISRKKVPWLGKGYHLLHLAIVYERTDVIRFLLPLANIELTKVNSFGATPLLIACIRGNTSVVKVMLDFHAKNPGIDIGLSTLHKESGYTPFHKACIKNNVDVVKEMLGFHAEHPGIDIGLSTSHQENKNIPFYSACLQNNTDVVKEMLDFHVKHPWIDIGLLTLHQETKNTSFHKACRENNADVVKKMLYFHANHPWIDIGLSTHHQRTKITPFHAACIIGNTDVIKVMFDFHVKHPGIDIGLLTPNLEIKNTPFHEACLQKNADVVKKMLDFHANHPWIDIGLSTPHQETKYTPFHAACISGITDVIKVMLDFHAKHPEINIGLSAPHQQTKRKPLEAAFIMDRTDIVNEILKWRGFNVEKLDNTLKIRIIKRG